MTWRHATALEAIQHAQGRTVAPLPVGAWGLESTVRFTDGTAIRIDVEAEHHYSEYTSDPARVIIEIGVPG